MPDLPSTRLHIDPPMDQWQVIPRNGRTTPTIATGHQPTLWHPGILAKDLAAIAVARHLDGSALHIVVDYDTLGPPILDLPAIDGSRLRADRYALGAPSSTMTRPANSLPAIDIDEAAHRLRQWSAMHVPESVAAGLTLIADAYQEAGHSRPNQAAQTTAVIDAMRRPLVGDLSIRNASTIVTQHFVDRLLDSPVACATAYNRAALTYPEAGIRPLYVGRDSVELPLWAQHTSDRTPVFADLGDSKPELFTQGQDLDISRPDALQHLRPRAITLSAIMRSEHCDLFIHGTGGGVYDRVTERWWQDWTGEGLAPKAVVSADVYLPFDVPVATRTEYEHAQWYAHHLPHNIDRYIQASNEAEAALIEEKRRVLDQMNDDRDHRRRAKAFQRIHAINAELRQQHGAMHDAANQQAEEARIGIGNAAVAMRRDWCFALYPDQVLQDLADQIRSCFPASPR
ncbi:MAG: hypothetical protein AAGB26_08360 [Planctomycetota bacterium]